jgi:hypothetical protein
VATTEGVSGVSEVLSGICQLAYGLLHLFNDRRFKLDELGEIERREKFPDGLLTRRARALLLAIPDGGADAFDLPLHALQIARRPLLIPELQSPRRVFGVAPRSTPSASRRQRPPDVWPVREIATCISLVEPPEHVEAAEIDLAAGSREVLLGHQGYGNLDLPNEALEAGDVLLVKPHVFGIAEGRV